MKRHYFYLWLFVSLYGFTKAQDVNSFVAVVDSVYDRVDFQTGAIIGQGVLRQETLWNGSDSIGVVDIAGLCYGQGIVLHGHEVYQDSSAAVPMNDSLTFFKWTIDGVDTLTGYGESSLRIDYFPKINVYNVCLYVADSNGHALGEPALVQVRISGNPIRDISELPTISNADSSIVRSSFADDNATLLLYTSLFPYIYTKENNSRKYIPDGPYCSRPHAEQVIEIDEFSDDLTIRSESDISSVCITMEHSYMDDIRIELRCPSYDENVSATAGRAILKYSREDESSHWGFHPNTPIKELGWTNHCDLYPHDCDSTYNPYGIGLQYCWSCNENYTLTDGTPARTSSSSDLTNRIAAGPIDSAYVTYPPTPSYFHYSGGYYIGDTYTYTNIQKTHRPSNHEKKTDYYSPDEGFANLIGCPLNGEWKVIVRDFYGGDNGWIFDCSIDLNPSSLDGLEDSGPYDVAIDSVIWRPDTNYDTDFSDGVYKGLHVRNTDEWGAAVLSTPDTFGTFSVKAFVYDQYGCIWDTSTSITTFQDTTAQDTSVIINVNTISGEACHIFPNPTTGIISLTGVSVPADVEIYDIHGTLRHSSRYNGMDIDLSDLPTGLYFANIITCNGIITKKLVITRS